MIRSALLTAVALLTAAPSLPQTATQPSATIPVQSFPAIEQIAWTYETADAATRLKFSHGGSTSSFDAGQVPEIAGALAAASLAEPGAALSFSLAREPGALACTGQVKEPGRAAGTCRFDPDERYVAELARRGLLPENSGQVLILVLVDGRVALIDDLEQLGYRLDRVDDLVAAGALDATPSFAEGLRDAGLLIEELDDLIAARALGLDSAWLMAMARAGYPELRIDQAIQMRALGVTPDYAQRMSRALNSLGQVQ
jgi:hypothetical protein